MFVELLLGFLHTGQGLCPQVAPQGEKPWCSVSSTFHTYPPIPRCYGTTHLSFLFSGPRLLLGTLGLGGCLERGLGWPGRLLPSAVASGIPGLSEPVSLLWAQVRGSVLLPSATTHHDRTSVRGWHDAGAPCHRRNLLSPPGRECEGAQEGSSVVVREVAPLRGHLGVRVIPEKRRGAIRPPSLPSPGYGFSLHSRYLPPGDKGPSLEGRGMNFSLRISSEALRISCRSGTS